MHAHCNQKLETLTMARATNPNILKLSVGKRWSLTRQQSSASSVCSHARHEHETKPKPSSRLGVYCADRKARAQRVHAIVGPHKASRINEGASVTPQLRIVIHTMGNGPNYQRHRFWNRSEAGLAHGMQCPKKSLVPPERMVGCRGGSRDVDG